MKTPPQPPSSGSTSSSSARRRATAASGRNREWRIENEEKGRGAGGATTIPRRSRANSPFSISSVRRQVHRHDHVGAVVVANGADDAGAGGVLHLQGHLRRLQRAEHIVEVAHVEGDLPFRPFHGGVDVAGIVADLGGV